MPFQSHCPGIFEWQANSGLHFYAIGESLNPIHYLLNTYVEKEWAYVLRAYYVPHILYSIS